MLRMNLFELYVLSKLPSLWLCADSPLSHITACNTYWAYLPSVVSRNLTRWTGKMVNMYMNRSSFQMPSAHKEHHQPLKLLMRGVIWQNVHLRISSCFRQTIVTGAGDETLRFWTVFPSSKSQNTVRDTGVWSLGRTHIR